MAAFQCGSHQLHVADAFEGIIDAAVCEFDDDFLDWCIVILRIDEIGGSEGTGEAFLVRIHVDGNDPFRTRHHRTLDGTQTDTA